MAVKLARGLVWALVLAGALGMLVPFLWMVLTSLRTDQEAFAVPPKLLTTPQWHNWSDAWGIAPFGRFFFNSFFVSICVTCGSLVMNSLAAYGFAKYEFRGRNFLFLCLLGTLMIPFQVTMIPSFLLLKQLAWLDSYPGLIVPGLASAFGIFFLRQTMLTIPNDYLDAARLDGASEYAIYRRVVLPLVKPAMATLAVFTFLGAWNDFLGPLIVVKSDEMRTLPLAISALSAGHYVMSWPLLMAGASFVVIPVLIVYFFAQRYFVEGIALGGLKG
ncbi:carbohydrate ABC transporter permease [Fimbriimonas ginsengisoli]|uniref:N-Acetyl-D-glucosamine ABC transport system, permease protein 2 n=1 Tax=Fimbriimonas ginsengisoli Gsoil 348 TaxID=661478 RepID=A0A068NQ42_FIMGI|nr:carbohydrate ABC transporter permease [Fimbriimonas ginsengisoli]AIE83724.1 N-Acetyl-D-glucosamine ABC transport system, permease protein 2 [Fimbriimonas ginsengisoli Gsoil 348]